jgi:hypothetical protein
MAVAGLRGTGDFGTDERPKDFRETILMRNPNGSSPIFALTSKVRKRVVTDPEYNWWDEANDIVRLQSAQNHASGVTTIVVDSGDPSAGANADRVYGSPEHLKEGDLLLVEPVSDNAAYAPEIIEVQQVINSTSFTVRRGAAGTTPGTIANDVFLTLIGSSYAEGTAAPTSVSRNPMKYSNFTQIFKDSYELSGTAGATKFRTGDPWSNDKKRKMFDHSRGIELAMLFGIGSEITGANGKMKRTMNGIRKQIPSTRSYVYSGGTTWFDLVDRLYPVFDFDTPAGDERIAFCGNGALNALNKIIAADSNSDINWGGVVKVYGMNLRELILPQGRLLLRTHPLLNRHSLYTKSMWVLDFASITYVTLKGRDTRVQDNVQNKDEDVNRGFIQTECSIEVDRGGLTQAYIGNINYTPET